MIGPARNEATLIAGILVGGASRRMGRPKALLPHPSGGTFVEHVAAVAARAANEVVLLGRPLWPLPDALRGLRLLPDLEIAAAAGPLAGLGSLLRYAPRGWTLLLSCDLPHLQAEAIAALTAAIRNDVDAVAFLEQSQFSGGEPRSSIRADAQKIYSARSATFGRIEPENTPAASATSTGRDSSTAAPQRGRESGERPPDDAFYHACCACYHTRALAIVERCLEGSRHRLQDVLHKLRLAVLLPDDAVAAQLHNVNGPGDWVKWGPVK